MTKPRDSRRLFCGPCANRAGGVVVAQGSWIESCWVCGERTSQAFEVIKPKAGGER